MTQLIKASFSKLFNYKEETTLVLLINFFIHYLMRVAHMIIIHDNLVGEDVQE